MKPLSKKLSNKLKQLQQEQTQRAFAKKLGIDVATLNRILQEKENITLKTIQKLCDNLKCDVGSLFEEDK